MAVSDGVAVAGSAGGVRSGQTAWKRHRRFGGHGSCNRICAQILAEADVAGEVDWAVCVDSAIDRAHQQVTNLPRTTGLSRVTGVCSSSQPITRSDRLGADCRRRSITSSTGVGCRWSFRSAPDRPTVHPCCQF